MKCRMHLRTHLKAVPLLIKVKKKILEDIISPPIFFALFWTEKISALLVCEEKKPPRSLPGPTSKVKWFAPQIFANSCKLISQGMKPSGQQ